MTAHAPAADSVYVVVQLLSAVYVVAQLLSAEETKTEAPGIHWAQYVSEELPHTFDSVLYSINSGNGVVCVCLCVSLCVCVCVCVRE